MTAAGEVKKDTVNTTARLRCTEYYLNTTYYYSDGTTSTSSVYLTTNCYDDGTGGGNGDCYDVECEDPNNSPSNPTWEEPEIEYAVARHMIWEVHKEQGYLTNGSPGEFAKLNARIILWGKKNSSEPQGGHFDGYSEKSVSSENFSTYRMDYWIDNNNYWGSAQTAHHIVAGQIIHEVGSPNPPPVTNFNKEKTWDFLSVFP